VAVRGDDLRLPLLDELPAESLSLRPVKAEQARRVDLQRPAALGQLQRQRRSLLNGLRPLRVRDERREARRLDVLAQREQLIGRAGERHLDEHQPRSLKDVSGGVLVEERPRGRQLVPEPQLQGRSVAEPLEGVEDRHLPRRRQDEVRPDVRRRVEDLRSRLGGQLTEPQALGKRLGPVVARGHDVRMAVDEARSHARDRTGYSARR